MISLCRRWYLRAALRKATETARSGRLFAYHLPLRIIFSRAAARFHVARLSKWFASCMLVESK